MKYGRLVCNTLKQIRLDVARANGIDYVPAPCTHKGDCAGTCPACESEVEYLEKEIARRHSLGKAVLIAGIGLTSLTAMASNTSSNVATASPNSIQSQVSDTTLQNEVFGMNPHRMPSFPGGDAALMRFISEHVVYPEEAYKNGIEGKVIVQFLIEETGKVGEVKVARSVSEELDREAVRVIKLLPDFIPAYNRIKNEPMKIWYTMPVTFKLQQHQQTDADVRRCVEQMIQVGNQNVDQILTPTLNAVLAHVHSIFSVTDDDTFVEFSWAPGILDVCNVNGPEVRIVNVNIIAGGHAVADMLYVDNPCYEIPYTLDLLWEDGEWKIDDVFYSKQEEREGWCTLRDQCSSLYDLLAQGYINQPAQDVIAKMLAMEPTENAYNDPATIYYNNPKELNHLIEQISNGHELLKKNPGYTSAMSKQLNDMIARIKKHI